MKNVKNVKKNAVKNNGKKNIVSNRPKKVNPEQIVKDRLAAKAAAQARLKGKIKRTPEPKTTSVPKRDWRNENVCEEMPVEIGERYSETDEIPSANSTLAEREEIMQLRKSFRLDLGTDPDKFIQLLEGKGYCPTIPGEPSSITRGRFRQIYADYKDNQPEKVEKPKPTVDPITLTVKAEDPSKLRGLTITVA